MAFNKKEYNKKYRESHKKEIYEKHKEYEKEYRLRPGVKERQRDSSYKRNYGITLKQYELKTL